jgi:hypothetical protein
MASLPEVQAIARWAELDTLARPERALISSTGVGLGGHGPKDTNIRQWHQEAAGEV